MADEDGEVGQACLHWKNFGETGDVVTDAAHQILYAWKTDQLKAWRDLKLWKATER